MPIHVCGACCAGADMRVATLNRRLKCNVGVFKPKQHVDLHKATPLVGPFVSVRVSPLLPRLHNLYDATPWSSTALIVSRLAALWHLWTARSAPRAQGRTRRRSAEKGQASATTPQLSGERRRRCPSRDAEGVDTNEKTTHQRCNSAQEEVRIAPLQ